MRVNFGSNKYTNKDIQKILPDGAWRDEPVFIVGGGPSLKEFDFNLLKDKKVIGINRAYEKIDPTIIFGMDTSFLKWVLEGRYGKESRQTFLNSSAIKVWLATHPVNLPGDIYIVRVARDYRHGLKAFTWSFKNGIGHGNNSGYASINLACCLGANPIYLLGFDMKFSPKGSHWHNGHIRKRPERVFKKFAGPLTDKAPAIKKHGFKVINLVVNGPQDTGLKCFPIKKYNEVLK